ncbi:MAG: hypothetical protein ACXAC7_18470 [Candidatus Hodarchaeales archaeon]|jgi:hypothetical protein
MVSEIQDVTRWKTILQGQCAYRSSNLQTGKMRCKHLFTNTAVCHLIGCPIVQPKFVALQRSYDTIYLVRKNPEADQLNEIWSDEELPSDKDEAQKIVIEALTDLPSELKDATLAKFEHLFQIITTIRESLEEEDEDLTLDDEVASTDETNESDNENDDNEEI